MGQSAAQEGGRDRRDQLRVTDMQHEVQAISMGTEPLAPPAGGASGSVACMVRQKHPTRGRGRRPV